MDFEAWRLFCVIETLLCLQPGPSALVVISLGMTRGQSAGILATVGVLAANAIYFAVAATGLAALLHVSFDAFVLVKWLGAGYLVWLGVRMILRSFGSEAASAELATPDEWRQSFWRGFLTQGSNPALLVYFTAILPQFIDADASVALQVAILAASSLIIEFTVLCGYSVLSDRAGQRTAPRFRRVLERVGGGLLIGAAAGLASIQRD